MPPRLAIVGATGLVGQDLLKIIEEEQADFEALGLIASKASAGERLRVLGAEYTVTALADCDFSSYDAAFFCVGDELSTQYVPQARAQGCAVVDKSNTYRLDPAVPLVVPGVNDAAIRADTPLVANPNCTTIVLCLALGPLMQRYGISRMFVATYQSVSGAGRSGIELLSEQLEPSLSGNGAPDYELDAERIAFNVHPQIGHLDESGRAGEEVKLIEESKKILAAPSMQVICHAARVPVFVGHAIAVTVELEQPAKQAEIIELWESADQVQWMAEEMPTPVGSTVHDQVEAGRLRAEPALSNGWSFFVCGDNLHIGAALNGWRILQLMQRAGAV